MTYAIPRARTTDPITSHAAAAHAGHFNSHKQRILDGIKLVIKRGSIGATAAEIADASGLTVVQVDRRLVELRREGLTFVYQYMGGDLIRHGYRIWGVV